MADEFDASTIVGDAPPRDDPPAAEPAPSAAPDAGATTGKRAAPKGKAADAKERKRASDREAQRRRRERIKSDSARPSTTTAPAANAVEPATPPLVDLLPALATMYATATNDGRGLLLAQLRDPMTGRTLAANVGASVDDVLRFYSVTITAEAVVWTNLALALGSTAMMIQRLPALTVAEAAERLPQLQEAMGGSH